MERFRVNLGRRNRYFDTEAAAREFCNQYAQQHNVILSIEFAPKRTKLQIAMGALSNARGLTGQAKAAVARDGVRISSRTWIKAITLWREHCAITDVVVSREGNIFLVDPRTEVARTWLLEHVAEPQYFGNALVVDQHYMRDLYTGMCNAGLEVK